jgi:hypothetical protein
LIESCSAILNRPNVIIFEIEKGVAMNKTLMLIFPLMLISLNVIICYAQPPTYFVTANARAKPEPNRAHYRYREMVNVTGSFYFEGQPVEGAIVAVKAEEIGGDVTVVRTASIGNVSQQWDLNIISITPCDQSGKPKTNFYRNGDFFVNVTVENKLIVDRRIMLVAVAADIDSTPLGINWVNANIAGKSMLGSIFNIWLPEWSSTGPSKVWVSLLSDWPENNGYPYCPEKTASFNILSYSYADTSQLTTTITEDTTQSSSNTTYRASFRMPPKTAPYNANYTVYVGAYYNGWPAFRNTTFQVKYAYPEDYDYDFYISIFDLVRITSIYGKKSGNSAWNPQLDFKPNGKIDINDVVSITSKFGKKYTE